MAEEELDAIKAIFSLPGEVRVDSSNANDSKQCTVVVKPYDSVLRIFPNCSLTVVVTIPDDYPALQPTCSVFSEDLPRQDLSKLRSKATQYLESPAGALPGILPLIMSLQDEFSSLMSERLGVIASLSSPVTCGSPRERDLDNWLLLVRIDHMRAKVKYTKTLTNWSTELGLTGRLFFHGKLILNLIQGDRHQLKEYIVRQKTVNVDVDSRGQKCKERLLNVICEERLPAHALKYPDYKSVECEELSQLEEVFLEAHLNELFETHVKPLCSR